MIDIKTNEVQCPTLMLSKDTDIGVNDLIVLLNAMLDTGCNIMRIYDSHLDEEKHLTFLYFTEVSDD